MAKISVKTSAKASVVTGAVIDGFTIGECVHRGGMATLWSATHPRIAIPLLMKIPRVSEGEDPAAIVSFEMEQMILPRLSGLTCRPVSAPAISQPSLMS
jgi:eukaryotic-like serine/threonine-protein kinase